MREQGKSFAEIGEKLGISRQGAHQLLNYKPVDETRSAGRRTKITDPMEVLDLYETSEMTHKDLADKYGVTISAINNALKKARMERSN